MKAKELISDVIPALKTSDTGLKALNWMEVFRVSHLPIVNNKELLGLISDSDIYDLNSAEQAIGSHALSLFSPHIYENQHIYEVIELVYKLKLTTIPVLDVDKNYLGVITMQNILQQFAELAAVHSPGGIIVLQLHVNDYSLTEIAQIVESNDAKVLSAYASSSGDSMKMELTLKLSAIDITSILQTFERYNYDIKASYLQNDQTEVLNEERYDMLMNYLSI